MTSPDQPVDSQQAVRDIADVAAVEVITTAAVHLMSAAAVKCGLAEGEEELMDLDEARKLINALAALVVTSAPDTVSETADEASAPSTTSIVSSPRTARRTVRRGEAARRSVVQVEGSHGIPWLPSTSSTGRYGAVDSSAAVPMHGSGL